MTEYRCRFCHRLLFKLESGDIGIAIETIPGGTEYVLVDQDLETKCPKCGTSNTFPIGIKKSPEVLKI